MVADGFPLLNALKEVHILLTQGAHNQYGDLPWTARQEMLMQQWMLARPGDARVPAGTGMVDVPGALDGFGRRDEGGAGLGRRPALHFRDLGVFGEQIVLIRFGAWSERIEAQHAANWARYWRPEIQGYMYAYRAVTGVDLTERPDATAPSLLLRQRMQQSLPTARTALERPQPVAQLPMPSTGSKSAAGGDRGRRPRFHVSVLPGAAASAAGTAAVAPADHRGAGRPGRARLGQGTGRPYSRTGGHRARRTRGVHAARLLGPVRDARGGRLACYVDAGAYPIAGWGIERAVGRGTLVRRFPHQDAGALGRLLRARAGGPDRVPVVVTDGVCPGCGRLAPIRRYLGALRPLGGLLVIDDTQALGVFGRDAAQHPPYGRGGGGSLRMAQLTSPDVLIVSSLAKAFGVPVAVIAGRAALVERYERRSETRVHCSPPSLAHIRAAEHALEVNLRQGEQRRARLAALVRRLQDGVGMLGHRIGPAQFPVQALGPIEGVPPAVLHRRLLDLRVRAVLHRPTSGR